VIVQMWERHLAAITVEAGRLSHMITHFPAFMLFRPRPMILTVALSSIFHENLLASTRRSGQ
jgi:hypothetical protein